MPNSFRTTPSNAQRIKRLVERKFQAVGKPIFIVAHSKACQEVLYMSLSYPELYLDGKLAGVCYVQGSFLGSTLINILLGEEKQLSFWYKVSSILLKPLPSNQNLKLNAMYEDLHKLYKNLAKEKLNIIERKMVNIKSTHLEGHKLSPVLRLGYYYFSQYFHKSSDGLITLEQQTMPFLNIKEIEKNGDHSHHFTSFPVTSSTRDHRFQITEEILRLLLELH